MIKLKITKFDKNEKYDEQLASWEQSQRNMPYNNRDGFGRPEPETAVSILEVEVTEEQWEAIRKSVLEKF